LQQLQGIHRGKRVNMKSLFKASVFIMLYLLLSACGESSPRVSSTITPVPSQAASTATPLPSQTTTSTPEPTPQPEFVWPTLIPTIDPALVPGLLSEAFSIQPMEGVNGHRLQLITGWDDGFGGGLMYDRCRGHYWLDTSHLLLYPSAGEVSGPAGMAREIKVVPQPVVINIENGSVWLPPVSGSSPRGCERVYWSRKLKILITSEIHDDISTVSTYTFDGRRLASYPGSLWDVSPRGTKILVSEDTLIDLKTNKMIKLAWSLEDYNEPHLSYLYWTYPEETRVYRCCYFYADITSGISERFQRSDFRDSDGNHLDNSGLWFHQGEWVLDNKYFLVHWLAVDDGPVRHQPLFDPATKLFYDLWELAGISPDLTWRYNEVSPDGNYVWIVGFERSYLVNLTTFESQHYRYQASTYTDVDWSADSKFVWLQTHDSDNKSTEFQILSISGRKLSPLPIAPLPDSDHWWHPIEASVVYTAADKDALIFLHVSTMLYQELPFALKKQPYTYGNVVWSPDGEKLALVAEDGSVWQVDYPTLENLEQLTSPLPNVHEVNWSPDGNSIAFISGSDIYVVETTKK
jgi:hypothetical protein